MTRRLTPWKNTIFGQGSLQLVSKPLGLWQWIKWFGRVGSSNKTIGATHFVLEAMAEKDRASQDNWKCVFATLDVMNGDWLRWNTRSNS